VFNDRDWLNVELTFDSDSDVTTWDMAGFRAGVAANYMRLVVFKQVKLTMVRPRYIYANSDKNMLFVEAGKF